MRTYGTATSTGKRIHIEAEAHVLMRLKRMLHIAAPGPITIARTPENAEDLEWFNRRYPFDFQPPDLLDTIRAEARSNRANKDAAEAIVRGEEAPEPIDSAIELRDYQLRCVAFLRLVGRALCGDDLGLGKTANAIGGMLSEWGRPAVVVCQTHLQAQWRSEIGKFAPGLTVHTARFRDPFKAGYDPHAGRAEGAGFPDVYIVPYTKLAGWADWLIENDCARFVIFDEAQELRKTDSLKYKGATAISARASYVLGLTATPVYNYGDEMHAVIDAISPGSLGTRAEFTREWCTGYGTNYKVSDPAGLGTYLRDRKLVLRRRRSDVGRELPAINTVVKAVPFDEKRLTKMKAENQALAHQILTGSFEERGSATRQLDMKLRQATGIAKAPFVAEFLNHLVESGEKIVLAGWHREVYDIWLKHLTGKTVLYTGTESPKQKQAAVDEFTDGDADVFIMSLRSGAGLDGLQKVASMLVIGELDWSPEVHNQIAGRLNRDGQDDTVTVCYLIAEGGSDPLLAGMLNLKGEQAAGIVDPSETRSGDLFTGSAQVHQEDTKGRMLAKLVLEGMTEPAV